nr:MAG TPA: hypothetical protein [Caudoviricetes sp.]
MIYVFLFIIIVYYYIQKETNKPQTKQVYGGN